MMDLTQLPNWRNLQPARTSSTGKWLLGQFSRPCARLRPDEMRWMMEYVQVEVGEMNQVFNVMDQLAGDTEPSVRAELMEQVVWCTHFCVCKPYIIYIWCQPMICLWANHISGASYSHVLPRASKQRWRHGNFLNEMVKSMESYYMETFCRCQSTCFPWLLDFSQTPTTR